MLFLNTDGRRVIPVLTAPRTARRLFPWLPGTGRLRFPELLPRPSQLS